MRILLAAKYVHGGRENRGGVQSWTKTVLLKLLQSGHEVELWEPGFAVPNSDFDIGIFANHGYTSRLVPLCKRTINVVHGIIPDEAPNPQLFDEFIYVSHGVSFFWTQKGMPQGKIIGQPIDTDFWSPEDVDYRIGVVRWSYRNTELMGRELAGVLNEPYIHMTNLTHSKGRDVIRRSRLVIASGRAALEAMSCGVPTLIYDHRGYNGGPLLCKDMGVAQLHSYSGRSGIRPALKDLVQAADDAFDKPEEFWREWVLNHHNAAKITQELIE